MKFITLFNLVFLATMTAAAATPKWCLEKHRELRAGRLTITTEANLKEADVKHLAPAERKMVEFYVEKFGDGWDEMRTNWSGEIEINIKAGRITDQETGKLIGYWGGVDTGGDEDYISIQLDEKLNLIWWFWSQQSSQSEFVCER